MLNFLSFLMLLLLATGTGYIFLLKSMKSMAAAPFSLRIGAAYFIGIAFYIVSVRTLSSLLKHTDWAVICTIAVAGSLCLFFHKTLQAFTKELFSKKTLYVIISIILFSAILLIYWLPTDSVENPFASIGSLHSNRYAWIANFISACNTIPVIGQNTGQSILTYMTGTLSGNTPFFFLSLWLYSSILFLAVFLYGFISLYENRGWLVLCAVLMVMLGNSALSLTHVLTIDSGSPFAMNGYTDTLFGIFSALMLLLFHSELSRRNERSFHMFPLAILLCIANFFTSPQNMLYLLAALPLLILLYFKTRKNLQVFVFWSVTLLTAALIAVPQGGMLTPKSLHSLGNIPGLMSTENSAEAKSPGVHLLPGIPFYFGWGGDWKSGQSGYLQEAKIYLDHPKENLMPLLWVIEQLFFTSMRVLFFPIAGLLALILLARKTTASTVRQNQVEVATPSYMMLGIFGAYTFIIGFFIDFTFIVNNYKWELSRFMIPGILLGLLGISLYALALVEHNGNKGRPLLAILFFIMTFGPILNLFVTSTKNIKNVQDRPALSQRLDYFMGMGPDIQQTSCGSRVQED